MSTSPADNQARRGLVGLALRPTRVPVWLFASMIVVVGYVVATTTMTPRQELVVGVAMVVIACIVGFLMRTMHRRYPTLEAAEEADKDEAERLPSGWALWYIITHQRVPLVYAIVMVVALVWTLLSIKFPWLA